MPDETRNAPLYRKSFNEARCYDQVSNWRQSKKLNVECKNAIEKAISDNFDGMRLNADTAKELCEQYGIERVGWVLANTVQQKTLDGRFRNENKEWAQTFPIPTDPENYITDYCVNSHPEVVNGLINQYKRHVQSLGILQKNACIESDCRDNYEGKLLILKPSALSDEYRKGDFQYFFAHSGFGCDPNKLGTKVFGEFLYDGEQTSFARRDFLGVADESQLPNWAVNKLQELTALCEQDEGMGGIE